MSDSPTPHGEGFSFIDSFEITSHSLSLTAKKLLRDDLPFFRDHFPNNPIMPGALLIESTAQAAGILWASNSLSLPAPFLFLAQVLAFKIVRPVRPNQLIEITATLDRVFGSLAQFTVTVSEGGSPVASGKIVLSSKEL
jgi:3-hydroxyacyl-[acyl-carrier-protein] dehydratase